MSGYRPINTDHIEKVLRAACDEQVEGQLIQTYGLQDDPYTVEMTKFEDDTIWVRLDSDGRPDNMPRNVHGVMFENNNNVYWFESSVASVRANGEENVVDLGIRIPDCVQVREHREIYRAEVPQSVEIDVEVKFARTRGEVIVGSLFDIGLNGLCVKVENYSEDIAHDTRADFKISSSSLAFRLVLRGRLRHADADTGMLGFELEKFSSRLFIGNKNKQKLRDLICRLELMSLDESTTARSA